MFAESISNSLIKSMHMRMGRPGLPVQPDGNVSIPAVCTKAAEMDSQCFMLPNYTD